MHAMIDLHNSSKYKVANTFNKEDTGRQLPTLEVEDRRYSNPTLSNAASRQLAQFLSNSREREREKLY